MSVPGAAPRYLTYGRLTEPLHVGRPVETALGKYVYILVAQAPVGG